MNDCTGESKRVQYKLVPVEPTEEMVSAGLSARTCPRERYQAMLAASPDFGSKVAAEVNQDEYGFCADILPGQRVRFGKPLYAHLQPAINITQVVEALQYWIWRMKNADTIIKVTARIIILIILMWAVVSKKHAPPLSRTAVG